MNNYKRSLFCLLVVIIFISLLSSCRTSLISLRSVYTSPDPAAISNNHQIKIEGDLQGTGTIQFDQNSCSLTEFGDIDITTLVYYYPVAVTFDKLNIADTTGKDREVFRLVGTFMNPGFNYYLVVPGNRRGPYRLVIERVSDNRRSVVTLERREQ